MRYSLLIIVTLLSISSLTIAEKKPIKLQSSAEFNQRSSLTPAAKNNTLPIPEKSTLTSPMPRAVTLSTPAPIYYQPTNPKNQIATSPEIKNNAGIMLNSIDQSSSSKNSGWMITQ